MSYKIEVRSWYENEEADAIYEVDGYVEDCVFYDNHYYLDNGRGDGRADIVKCIDSANLK